MGRIAAGVGMVTFGAFGAVGGAEAMNAWFPSDRELTEKLAETGPCLQLLPPDSPIVIESAGAFGEPCEDLINEYIDTVPPAQTEGVITLPDKQSFQAFFMESAASMRQRREETIKAGLIGGAVVGAIGFLGLRHLSRSETPKR